MQAYSWILPIAILILFELVADFFAKQYAVKGSLLLAVCAILGYIIGNIFFLIALKYGAGLARGEVMFSVGSAVFAILLGVLFFKEQVGIAQGVGLLFGIISFGLLAW